MRLAAALALAVFLSACGEAETELILATTTSTENSGLLDELLPAFEQDSTYRLKIIAVGSGAALRMGERGDADVLLVHSPAAERQYMADGYGERREPVMHNDFVLVGPRDDPAGARGQADVAAALRTIQRSGSIFVSRGDESGTHARELKLWGAAEVDPGGQPWYQESGQGMGATLIIASQKAAYTLTDRGTYLATRDDLELEVVSEGDERLVNPYHVITVRSQGSVTTNQAGADAFADFIVGRAAQTIIAGFGVERFGQPLFFADACTDCG